MCVLQLYFSYGVCIMLECVSLVTGSDSSQVGVILALGMVCWCIYSSLLIDIKNPRIKLLWAIIY